MDSKLSRRDIFLSHRSVDKQFVSKLAADIETPVANKRTLHTWLDEAEIGPGQSIPGEINRGLESSQFFGIVMTPAYFRSDSGWTDAEWHAALYTDPDNRRQRIVPLLAADCPYIPFLLRHLKAVDLRENNYRQGLQTLTALLRGEPIPRPVAHRGQLITSSGQIDRATLVAQRSVLQCDPDVVTEHLYCNLLPVERIPQYAYVAPVAHKLLRQRKDGTEALPSKAELKAAIRAAQEEAEVEHPFVPAFRVNGQDVITFHDLEAPDSPFASVIEDGAVERILSEDLLREEDGRNLLISLLNMAVSRHASRVGLVPDDTKLYRFFFPPKEGVENVITWIPKKVKAHRTVSKPCLRDGKVIFWRHLGAYLKIVMLAGKLYLQIIPTWVMTEDGVQVKTGPRVGALVIRWTGPERNLHVLYHVRFWTSILRRGRAGPISIRAGDQSIELSTMPAFIQQAFGIANDNRDLMGLLDREAEVIAESEDATADRAAQASLSLTSESEDEFPADEVDEEDSKND